ncbi:hypothetical protein BUALT_Bualt07G0073000 [Buddleja alternifolia]|uniref:CLAVATA3/ESR (CLE)-related protein 9 n=1 Tax=Buddleja alternifolia TaxID=168488 RepID=A0AAV6X8S2_9LAMI|nr:hypothetical protein BUALT_Bualt07G0073000 [Buddleja alternifolia]
MKNSTSTTFTSISCWILTIIIIVLIMAPPKTQCSAIPLQQILTTNPHNFPVVSNSLPFSPSPPRLLLQHRKRHQPPPPARDGGDEIDPRYGIQKRLVPSGPNPLHN